MADGLRTRSSAGFASTWKAPNKMARLHGLEAIERVEKYGGDLCIYRDHEPGSFAGLEFAIVEIENPEEDFTRLRNLCKEKPFLVYTDVEDQNADT